MRRCGLVLGLLSLAFAACSSQPSTKVGKQTATRPSGSESTDFHRPLITTVEIRPDMQAANADDSQRTPNSARAGGAGETRPALLAADLNFQQFASVPLSQGLNLMAEHRYEEALSAFGAINDSVLIPRVKRRMEDEAIAAALADDIEAILEDGNPEEASRLAAKSLELQRFGDTDGADRLVGIKRRADALIAVGLGISGTGSKPTAAGAGLAASEREAFVNRFRREFEDAEQEHNRRLALLALEQVARYAGDDRSKSEYTEFCRKMDQYDLAHARADRLRKDPNRGEEALEALEEASRIWNSASLLDEINDLRFQLLIQRDRVGVADFQVRGEVGIPRAGSLIADQLLGSFKYRFNLLDRTSLNEMVARLKLTSPLTAVDPAVREVGRLTHTRYLVVGTVEPIAGLTLRAQMVDTQSGLIVQTARLVVQNAAELTRQLPQLAGELLVNDADWEVLASQRSKQYAEVRVPPDQVVSYLLPLSQSKPAFSPAPLIPAWPKPPDMSTVHREQLTNFPLPPPIGRVVTLPVIPADRDRRLRGRSVAAAIDLGDNLFYRGQYFEALDQFEYAMSLAPERREVRRRVDRCRTLLPPLKRDSAPADNRPRIAVFDFLTPLNSDSIPPSVGEWMSKSLAPYLISDYQVADQGEMSWWMSRLGITPGELLTDVVARQYLCRALHLRYFLFGSVADFGGIDVTTYLIDAENAFLTGSGRIFVRKPQRGKPYLDKLKLQLKELANKTVMSPEQRRADEIQESDWSLLLNDMQMAVSVPGFPFPSKQCREWLIRQPGNVHLRAIMSDVERAEEIKKIRNDWGTDNSSKQNNIQKTQRQQFELIRDVHSTRLSADRALASLSAADRARFVSRRQQAAAELVQEADRLFDGLAPMAASDVYNAAVGLAASDSVYSQLSNVASQTRLAYQADENKRTFDRANEIRRRLERDIATANQQLAAEQKKLLTELTQREKLTFERDDRESKQLMALAHQLSTNRQFDEALAAVQFSLRLHPSAVDRQFGNQVLLNMARMTTEARGAAAKAELERELIAEDTARESSEATAEKNRKLFAQLVADGERSLREKKYDAADELFQKAKAIYQTDALLADLQDVKAARSHAESPSNSEQRSDTDLHSRSELIQTNLKKAKNAEAGGKFELAVQLLREARSIDPTDASLLVSLAKTQHNGAAARAADWRKREDALRQQTFQRLVQGGTNDLNKDNLPGALLALTEAAAMDSENAYVTTALAETRRRLALEGVLDFDHSRMEQYQNAIRSGRWLLGAGIYEHAGEVFKSLTRTGVAGAAAGDFEDEASHLNSATVSRRHEKSQLKAREFENIEAISRSLDRLYVDLAMGRLDEAAKASMDAVRLDSTDPGVVRALADLLSFQSGIAAASARESQRRQELDNLLKKAGDAFASKKYAEAAKKYESVLIIESDNLDARKGLINAQAAMALPH
jgi:hypothetical protein